MPAGRGRNGRAQDAVVQQTLRASRQGEPGIVKDLPPLPEWERGTYTGTEVESPARGSWDARVQNVAINLIMLEGRCRDGRCREIHAKANLVS